MSDITLTRIIKATPEKVFVALTDPDHIIKWFIPQPQLKCSHVDFDPFPGATYTITFTESSGQKHTAFGIVKDFAPPYRFAYTWNWKNWDIGETLITINLKPHAQGTELTFTHTNLPDDNAKIVHEQGWANILDRLDSFVQL